mgnify:CR=1 FL=1
MGIAEAQAPVDVPMQLSDPVRDCLLQIQAPENPDSGIADATDAQCVIMALKFPEDTSKLQVSSAQTV